MPITLDWFERYELLRGDAILRLDAGVAGGMLQVLREQSITAVPLLYAATCPGGPLTADCYQTLKAELLATLRQPAGRWRAVTAPRGRCRGGCG